MLQKTITSLRFLKIICRNPDGLVVFIEINIQSLCQNVDIKVFMTLLSINMSVETNYLNRSKLNAITIIPVTKPMILSCPFPYALLVGISSSRLI